jgi:polyhydroxybutyrate depolymerase
VLAQHIPVFGKTRSYTLVVPPTYASGTSYPLVYVLHGHGGSGAQARRALDLESVANGRAIFVYPDGLGGGWDLDSPASKNADVALFDATLAVTQSNYCIDLHRVFVTGFSNGAYMANQLGCRRGDRIRAVASHAGGGPYEMAGEYDEHGNLVCKGKPIASLVVHGNSDHTVAVAEGQKSIDHWSHANHCSGSSPAVPQGCVAYRGCANPVTACMIQGLGHGLWTQANRLTWTFFDAQK